MDTKLGNIWNKADDNKFSKVMIEKQIIGWGATIYHSTT